MKFLPIVLLIIIPISLFSQEANKFEIADSIINVKGLLLNEFGNEIMKQVNEMESIGNPYSYGIFQLNNILNKEKNSNNKKFPGGCQCNMIMGKLQISNAIGFMAGVGSVVEINLKDSTYQSKIQYHTDGARTHKFKVEEDFIVDIIVPLDKAKLVISPDSKFEHKGIIKGKLTGTSIKFYEEEYNEKGYEEVQMKVLSIFECKLEDYEQIMKELEMNEELEMLKRIEKENKLKEKELEKKKNKN